MPEGDTIWRTAARLRPALEGSTVTRFSAPRLPVGGPQPGTSIESVEAQGKYLLVVFDDGTTLETHMKMSGSWHLYRQGERWGRSPGAARAVIDVDNGWTAVCFSANHVVLRSTSDPGGTGHLGPDLCGPAPDLDEAADRFARFATDATSIGVALLDQRICCGVGNVYKSEVLHACRLDPTTPVGQIDLDVRRQLVVTAHRLLRANLGSGPRVTVPGGLAVYRRTGQPCARCGIAIERIVQGVHARSTYYCPGCQIAQPVPGPTMPDS